MTMNNDTKFEEELTCQFKTDMKNLTNFDPTLKKLKKLQGNGLFLTKVYNIWAKGSPEELFLMELTIDAKFEGKLTCAS